MYQFAERGVAEGAEGVTALEVDGIECCQQSGLGTPQAFVQLKPLVGPSVGVDPNMASHRLALVLFKTNICSVSWNAIACVLSSIRSIDTVRMVNVCGSGRSAAFMYLDGNAERMSM